ncbi:cbb3-type cytochrome c oxidase subunit I, partial [Klebsiella pneumoniae]|uniref:cbb3-type cytochrome c oxidase subunit I n=1 Tax=Klebsiella pneumoniae TaxID=573 RepID=UPI00272FBBAC
LRAGIDYTGGTYLVPQFLGILSGYNAQQSLGMAMSIILLAPSWGGMINGMMTLSGAWHKLRTDPILRFLVVSLAFYGMSTFEGAGQCLRP